MTIKSIPRDKPCPHCGRYANRALTVDAVIIKNGKVLLVRRGMEPEKGLWATPGGHIEWDESAEDALNREVKEETNFGVKMARLMHVNSSPKRYHQTVNLVYLVVVKDGKLRHGDDASDAKWFSLNSLPQKMAFEHKPNILSVKKSLKLKG